MPHPDDIASLRETVQALNDDSWSGWVGSDLPVVDAEDKDIDEALKELSRRTEDRLREYEESLRYVKPSEERRREKERIEYMLDQLDGKPDVSGT